MNKILLPGLFFILIAWGCYGDDLVLDNGSVYKKYQIDSVDDNKVTVLYIKSDGNPGRVVLDVRSLPPEIQKKLPGYKQKQPPVPRRVKNMQDKLMNYGDRLQFEMDKLDDDDIDGRRALGERLKKRLYKNIVAQAEKVDLAVIRTAAEGTLVKVVGTGKESKLRCGEKLFLWGFRPADSAFQLKIYPGGNRLKCGDHGIVDVYAVNPTRATAMAMDFIVRYLGDDSFIEPSQKSNSGQKAAGQDAAADDDDVFGPDNSSGTQNGNYYYTERDDGELPATCYTRRRPGSRLHRKSKPSCSPSGCTQSRPRKCTPAPVPGGGSRVVKSSRHSGNYGVLPSHLIPGTKGGKSSRK